MPLIGFHKYVTQCDLLDHVIGKYLRLISFRSILKYTQNMSISAVNCQSGKLFQNNISSKIKKLLRADGCWQIWPRKTYRSIFLLDFSHFEIKVFHVRFERKMKFPEFVFLRFQKQKLNGITFIHHKAYGSKSDINFLMTFSFKNTWESHF